MADQSTISEIEDIPKFPTNPNEKFGWQEVLALGARAVMEYGGRDTQAGDAVALFWTISESLLGPEAAITSLGELASWMTEAELIGTLGIWLAKARERQVIAAHVITCPECGMDRHDWPAIEKALAAMRKRS